MLNCNISKAMQIPFSILDMKELELKVWGAPAPKSEMSVEQVEITKELLQWIINLCSSCKNVIIRKSFKISVPQCVKQGSS